MTHRSILVVLTILALGGSSARAAIFTVNTTNDTYDGVCNAADCSLKDAIAAAVNTSAADTVVLQASATYTVATPFAGSTAMPQILNDVTVVGNGAVIQRDPSANNFNLFNIGSAGTLRLQNLTLRNGRASQGGAIQTSFGGILSLTDCIVENGFATLNEGGGIYHSGPGQLTIVRSSFRNNTAQLFGGGLSVLSFNPQGAHVTIVDSAFVGNQTLDVNNGAGGGITFSADVDATITSTTFSGNSAPGIGGGIAFNSVPVGHVIDILNCTIVDNNAGAQGGGLAEPQCTTNCPVITKPRLINTIVANNTAGFANVKNCIGQYDSGGHNIFGPPVIQNVNCTVANQSNDILLNGTLTNIASLSTTGNPGGEHHDLQLGNVGLNNADPALCPPTDQLTLGRIAVCERGAIEFRLPAPTINPCARKKKKCVGEKVESLLLCHAKAEKFGVPVDPTCLTTAYQKFASCCQNAELLGNCPDCQCDPLEMRVDDFVNDAVQALDPSYPTPVQNLCSSKKKKCVAKKATSLLKCHFKAEQTGHLSQTCLDNAHDAFDGGSNPSSGCFAQLEAQYSPNCLTTNDTAALETVVDQFVDDIVCCLDPAEATCTQPTPTATATATPVAPTPTTTPVSTATATPVPTATATPVPTATATPPPCDLPQPVDCQCQDGVTCTSGCPTGQGVTCAQAQQGCINLCTQLHGGVGNCPGACNDCDTGLPCQ